MTFFNKKLHIFPRVIVVLLALMLCMSAVPAAVVEASASYAAQNGTCGESLTWTFARGKLTISGSGEMTRFTDENMPPWYEFSQDIKKVTIEEGVTKVGNLAFFGCSNLKSIALPTSLTDIGDRAFKECTSLTHISFPSGLEHIGEAAFENCEKLSGIRLPNGLRTIGDYAFYRCYGLTSITVPASVQSFGMVVFAYCENLTQATIHCSLVKLPDWTFYGCKNLNAVVLPETVSAAGEYAFHECGMLNEIHYTGDAGDQLMEDIRRDDNSISNSGVITDQVHDGVGTKAESDLQLDSSVGKSEITTVKETENSTITKDVNTTSKYQIDGKDATVQDIVDAGEDVKVDSTSLNTVTITSTVDNSQGWTELAEEVEEALRSQNQSTIKTEVSVYVPDTAVSGEDLAKLAGKKVVLNIITNKGEVWKIDASSLSPKKTADKQYNLSMTVTEMEAGKTGIESDLVYKVEFAEDVDFQVTVGIHVGSPYQLATLYQKDGKDYEKLQTAMIDADGIAWFSLNGIDKKTEYYVGINVAGVTEQEAIIPETLYGQYGLEEDMATLMDAHGNAYKITGRTSSWGITAKQFGIYAAIIIGGAILIVTLAMITWNKIMRSKEQYAIPEPEDIEYEDDELDEEAIRMEIMRELLAEAEDREK